MVHAACGDLQRVAAAGEREQRVDGHRPHVCDAFGRDLVVHRRVVQVPRRGWVGWGGVYFDGGRAFFFPAAAFTAGGRRGRDARYVGDSARRGLVVGQRDRDGVADLDAALLEGVERELALASG